MQHYLELKDHVGRQVRVKHRQEEHYRSTLLAEIDQGRETYTFVWWAGNTDARNMIGFVNVMDGDHMSVTPTKDGLEIEYVGAYGQGELCPSVESPLFKLPEDIRRKNREDFDKFKRALEAQEL